VPIFGQIQQGVFNMAKSKKKVAKKVAKRGPYMTKARRAALAKSARLSKLGKSITAEMKRLRKVKQGKPEACPVPVRAKPHEHAPVPGFSAPIGVSGDGRPLFSLLCAGCKAIYWSLDSNLAPIQLPPSVEATEETREEESEDESGEGTEGVLAALLPSPE
jgi:hypothetical protein